MNALPKNSSWIGGRVSDRSICVLADNSSPMTLTGTNTWIISEPGCSFCAVVDPGPESSAHLEKIVVTCKNLGLTIGTILITHEHSDHDEAAPHLSRLTGASTHSRKKGNLVEGPFTVPVDGPQMHIVSLPGHSSDSVGIVVPAGGIMLTGDMIFRQSSTVICAPDGVLADYLESLQRLRSVVGQQGVTRLLPGHGPTIDNPLECIDLAIAHRLARLDQVRRALVSGVAADSASVVAAVYADVDPCLRSAAQWSVQAQLKYLHDMKDPV